MHRYFIEFAYKGTNFHGWQMQENAVTVQEELEKALTLILKENINLEITNRGVEAYKVYLKRKLRDLPAIGIFFQAFFLVTEKYKRIINAK